jgi:PST family polysaccharide transporter
MLQYQRSDRTADNPVVGSFVLLDVWRRTGKEIIMSRGYSFVRGAAILGAAAFVSKLLGALYKVPYQNITGNEGLFVYQQVYPLYSTLLLLATAGFPTAISKMVSERLAEGDRDAAGRIFRVATVILSITGLCLFVLLFVGAETIATWMGSQQLLTLPIRTVSFALLVVPVVSVIRGYFQGHQDMMPTAVSQVMEQLVRVATILIAAWWFMTTGAGVVMAGAGAMFGAFTGATAALVFLLFTWNRHFRGQPVRRGTATGQRENEWQIARQLLVLSLPICLGSLVMPLLSLTDSFTVTNILLQQGWQPTEAVAAKGIFDRGQPLIQFASFFAGSLSLSLVPAIASARAHRDEKEVLRLSHTALRLTVVLGLPASVGLAIVARPTNVMLYEDAAGTAALSILAFAALFSMVKMTAAGVLQGLGNVYLPARNLLIGVAVKVVANLLLIPVWDIRGAALATVLGYGVAAQLNLRTLRQMGIGWRWRDALLPLTGPTAAMSLAVWFAMWGLEWLLTGWLPERLMMTIVALISVSVGVAVYGFALIRFGVVSRADLENMPKIGPKLIPLAERLRRSDG